MKKLNKLQKEWLSDFPSDRPEIFAEWLAELYSCYPFGDWTINELIQLLEKKQKEATKMELKAE